MTTRQASGVWSDGRLGILSRWDCPDGGQYVLGACTEGYYTTESADPAPTIDHMRLIALVNGANPVDAWNTSFAIPSGVSGAQLTFQANDIPLSDNLGAISFHIQVCKGSCGTSSFAFATDGWSSTMAGYDFGSYAGKWTSRYSGYAGGSQECRIWKAETRSVVSVTVIFDSTIAGDLVLSHDGNPATAAGFTQIEDHPIGVGSGQSYTFTEAFDIASNVRVDLATIGGATPSDQMIIHSIEIC